MIKTIEITSNESDFFSGVDTDGINELATQQAFKNRVEMKLQNIYPDVDVVFTDAGVVVSRVTINNEFEIGDPEVPENAELVRAAYTVDGIMRDVWNESDIWVEEAE